MLVTWIQRSEFMKSTLIDITGKLPTGMVNIYREVFAVAGQL
ncbi:hypothetical protein THIOSC15_1240009 [uncultured Thiomicrorhabdus sp.]